MNTLVAASLLTAVLAHPQHLSVAEAEWNAESQVLEIAMQVDPLDLEQGLRQHTGRFVDLDRTPELDRLLEKYLATVFQVAAADEHPLVIEWVGHEVEPKAVWLYFQVPAPRGGEGLRISHTLFMDHLPDQVNLINLKRGSHRQTLSFQARQTRQTLHW